MVNSALNGSDDFIPQYRYYIESGYKYCWNRFLCSEIRYIDIQIKDNVARYKFNNNISDWLKLGHIISDHIIIFNKIIYLDKCLKL